MFSFIGSLHSKLYVSRTLLSSQQSVHWCWHRLHVDLKQTTQSQLKPKSPVTKKETGGKLRLRWQGWIWTANFCWLPYLAYTGGQQVDNPLVRDGDHALPVDLNDPVAHPHPTPLCYSSPQQTADLQIFINNLEVITCFKDIILCKLVKFIVKSKISPLRSVHWSPADTWCPASWSSPQPRGGRRQPSASPRSCSCSSESKYFNIHSSSVPSGKTWCRNKKNHFYQNKTFRNVSMLSSSPDLTMHRHRQQSRFINFISMVLCFFRCNSHCISVLSSIVLMIIIIASPVKHLRASEGSTDNHLISESQNIVVFIYWVYEWFLLLAGAAEQFLRLS